MPTILTKEMAREIRQGDYIPKGIIGRVDANKLSFRKTTEHEIHRCCQITGNDPQSGPIYCGEIAEFIAFHNGGIVVLCGNRGHVPPK